MSKATREPEVVEYGPCRAIGLSYQGKNENQEVMGLWDGPSGFIARHGEVQRAPGCEGEFLGVCRCIPGATDGSFEYLACLPAAQGAKLPGGMVALEIAGGTYAKFPVEGLSEIAKAWEASMAWFEQHSEWATYCGPAATGPCECDTHPSFELYPPGFDGSGRLYLMLPMHRR